MEQRMGAGVKAGPIDTHEAVLAYVQRLDRAVAEATEATVADALAALDREEPPEGVPTGHLLERKRRELLARFDLARSQVMRAPDAPPGGELDAWLRYFLASAEMAGADAVELRWAAATRNAPRAERVPLAEGRAWRARLADVKLGALTAIAHLGPGGEAMYDVPGGWLSLHGPAFFMRQTQRALDEALGGAPLALQLTWDHAKEVMEGAALQTRLTLTNVSDDVVVLDALTTDLPYDAAEHFRRASMGTLAPDPREDAWVYDASAATPTAPAFYTAVLRPGQARTIMLPVKMLEGGEGWRELRLRYARFAADDFPRLAYVPVPGRGDSFPPVVMYRPLAEHPEADAMDLSTVLLPGVGEDAWRETAWAAAFFAARRRFSLAQARARLGQDAAPVHFSRWQQAWIMATADGCAVVAPSRVTLYPRVDPACFALIDEAEQRVPLRFAEAVMPTFRSLPLGIADWESHALGLSVSLPKLKLTSLFQEIDRMGCAMGVGRNLLGRPTIVIGA